MLKLVGTHRDGTIADERVLLDANDRPTAFLLGLAALELALDVTLAVILAKTVFKSR
ncbi:MAG: hypothetical protein IJ131_01555 [Eggerthellaceae bacterium]|nr:hypothetical protein [Eggerthellaceae bacterium]